MTLYRIGKMLLVLGLPVALASVGLTTWLRPAPGMVVDFRPVLGPGWMWGERDHWMTSPGGTVRARKVTVPGGELLYRRPEWSHLGAH